MTDKPQFFIDGEWQTLSDRPTMDLVNPATEQVSGKLHLGNEDDVDRAVKAARNAFPGFAATSLNERIELLQSITEGYKARFDDIGSAISEQMGAPKKFAVRFQAGAGLSHFKQVLKIIETYNFERDINATRVIREPIGVCGMIVPWNWPMNQITCKVAPALAVGCTMVLKPSELAPGPAIILAELLEEAGVPRGVFNMVQGEGPVVGAAIARHPDVDMVSFTGSTHGGIAVAEAAAPTIKRVGQELGGKSANILLDDVDFEDAVTRGVTLCFRNSGQSCNSPTRMLVPRASMVEVAEIAKHAAEGIRVGDPNAEDTVMGPVVSKKQWSGIQRYIRSGINEGATLVTGGLGRPVDLPAGYFVQPTVFTEVTPEMTIAREEIFGPVLSIMAYDDEVHAVTIANDTPFGLAAYIESADLARAQAVARRRVQVVVVLHAEQREASAVVVDGGQTARGVDRGHQAAGVGERRGACRVL